MTDYAHIDCTYLHHTAKAVLVAIEGVEVWLPLSQLDDSVDFDTCGRGEDIELAIPIWLLRAKDIDFE